MRTMKREYHLGLQVPEDLYKVDLQVVERYIAFSAETLRMASFGLAGYGFLIAEVLLKASSGQGQTAFSLALTQNKYVLAAGAVSLGLSVATALAHRYYATECLTHFVRGLRLRDESAAGQLKRELEDDPLGPTKTADRDVSAMRKHENTSLDSDLRSTKWTLRVSATLLAAGAGCVAWAFAMTLAGLH